MNLIGKYCIHYDAKNPVNGIFLGLIVEEIMGHTIVSSIRVLNIETGNHSICYTDPKYSIVNKGIIDFSNYLESNREAIKSMLLSSDDQSRNLALEILKQHNCFIL